MHTRVSAQLSYLARNYGERPIAAYNPDAKSQVRQVFPCEERAASTNMRRYPRHALLKTCESAQARVHEGPYHFFRAKACLHREGETTYVARAKHLARDARRVSQTRSDRSR